MESGTSLRIQKIGIKLPLDLQSDLVKQETCERLEERDRAIYEDMASLNQSLDCHRRDISHQANQVS